MIHRPMNTKLPLFDLSMPPNVKCHGSKLKDHIWFTIYVFHAKFDIWCSIEKIQPFESHVTLIWPWMVIQGQLSTLRWHSRTWPILVVPGIRSRWRSVRGVFIIQVKITASWCRSFVSQEGGGHSQVWTKLDKVIVIYLQINKCAIREMNMISQL